MSTVTDVLAACQRGVSVHRKLLTSLKTIHDSYGSESKFFADFLPPLHHSLVCEENSPAVERTLEFVARFAHHLCPSAADPDDPDATAEEPEQVHPFFHNLFDFLLTSHDAGSQAVRLRCCQLLNKLLLHLGANAYLEDELYERLHQAMLERLQDVAPSVRVQAVFALSRLQEPKNKQCPVIRAYQFHMQNDPSADVRRAVLLNIAGSALTLPSVLERIRDVSAAVRRRAFLYLTKVHVKSISMSERRRLLKEGLQDRDDRVREAVQKDLLQFWLRLLEGSPTKLLRCLFVEMCPDVGEMVAKALCEEASFADMLSSLGLPEDTRLLPAEELTSEKVLLWRVLSDQLRSQGNEWQLERVTPDLPALCTLIERLTLQPADDVEPTTQRFVLRQLVALAAGQELWDEFSRRALAALVERLLRTDGLDTALVAPLVGLYERAVPAPAARLRALVETISEIRAPLTVPSQPVQPPEATEEASRQRRLQRAQLRVKQNELQDRLDAAVAAGDFATAQDVHAEQAQLQEQERQLQEPERAAEPAAESEEQGCAERDDPATLVKCLALLAELLRTVKLPRLPPELGVLVDSLVLPGIQCEDPDVRQVAVESLGLICLLSRTLAEQHLILFVQVFQADTCEVQLTAMRALFDLLVVFGPELTAPAEQSEEMAPLVTELVSVLDTGSVEMRGLVAEGLCKLLLHGRVTSPRLLERLVLMWYNPVLDGDHFLRNMLGVFFPTFSAASRRNQELLAEAMLPTLITLVQAPLSSPLVQVDGDDVACFFVQLTDDGRLPARQAQLPGCVHQQLAYRLLAALLDGDQPLLGRLLARALNQLQLTAAETTALRDLSALAEQAIGDADDPDFCRDKQRLLQLRKFRASVTTLLAARPEETATPAATPAPRRRRTEAASEQDGGTEDEEEAVSLAAGLDSSQASPQRPPPSSGVVPETPESADPDDATGGEEVFLGAASQDSAEFSTCLADESAVSRRGPSASDAAVLKRAAETPPPRPRPPAGRLSRRAPAGDKRGNQPTGSPAVVPPKKLRQESASAAVPRANVRRTRVGRASAPATRQEDDSSEQSISEFSSAVGSEAKSPAATGDQESDVSRASPDSVFSTGRRSGRSARARQDTANSTSGSVRTVEDTPESGDTASRTRTTRRAPGKGAGATTRRAPPAKTTRSARSVRERD